MGPVQLLVMLKGAGRWKQKHSVAKTRSEMEATFGHLGDALIPALDDLQAGQWTAEATE